MGDLYVAVVCSSNMNRSMEAHAFLVKKGFKVKSFGTGEKVKLPGVSADRPNCYEFGVPYDEIYNDLLEKDKTYYTQNGLLHMLDRNRRIKPYPEKFQVSTERFDVIITCEERVYDQVVDWFNSRRSVYNQPVHVINIDIQDNHEEATIGAFLISDMVTKMAQSDDLDNDIDELLHEFEAKCHSIFKRQMSLQAIRVVVIAAHEYLQPQSSNKYITGLMGRGGYRDHCGHEPPPVLGPCFIIVKAYPE